MNELKPGTASALATSAAAPHGVVQSKELVSLVVKLTNLGLRLAKNGKVSFNDIGEAVKLLPVLSSAVSGISQVPAELADLTVDEVEELAASAVTDLEVESEKAKNIISASFGVAGSLVKLIRAVKA